MSRRTRTTRSTLAASGRGFAFGAVLLPAAALAAGGCGTGGAFGPRPRPTQLVGTWVDSTRATATDTVAWSLGSDGADRELVIRVARAGEGPERPVGSTRADERTRATRYASWYVSGDPADVAARRLCFDPKGRGAPSCYRFRLDTLPGPAGGPGRRRLTVYGYRSEGRSHDLALLERGT